MIPVHPFSRMCTARTPILAAVTAMAGGIVITGDMDGRLIVLDGQTGRVVHEADTGAPVGAGIVTYEAGGRQYIAVAKRVRSVSDFRALRPGSA